MSDNKLHMIALLFDIEKIDNIFYGEHIFEQIIKGKEILRNNNKIVVSCGDVLSKEIQDDIFPFIIKNDLCSVEIENKVKIYNNSVYGVLLEDISYKIAKEIDIRLKKDCSAYIGMTSIDCNSKDTRKQFWKNFIRSFSIEYNVIVCFGYEEEGFMLASKAKEYGFSVNYDNLPYDLECRKKELFSTRQSSFIKEVSQLCFKGGKNDSDRGILEMNDSLVKEVEIAGVQIWKAIEDINKSYIKKSGKNLIIDYIFTSLYQAAQGIERLLKISIEIFIYRNEKYNKQKVDKLLYGHSHIEMVNYLINEKKLHLESRELELLELLTKFYKFARYNRYSYSEDNLLELTLMRNFGKNIKSENYDDIIKHMYGESLGKISRALYSLILQLSNEQKIFVYELNSNSVARFVFLEYYKEDLYSILKDIELSKKELIWFLIRKNKNFAIKEIDKEFKELPFDDMGLKLYLNELLCNENSGESIYDFVFNEYSEMIEEGNTEDIENLEKRKEFIKYIGEISDNLI